MESLTLPGTSLCVSAICLGTGEVGSSLDRDASFRVLDAFAEGGGTFLDTAHNYGDWVKGLERGASEKTIGHWMRERGNRGDIILATKGAHWHLDRPDVPRLSRDDIVGDLDASLENLQTDRIDLYWLHRDDPQRPVGEILETLNAQAAAGKIRYFGASNWKTERLRAAREYAQAHGLRDFVADQVLWNAAVLAGPPYGDPTVGWMDAERYTYHRETGLAAVPFQSQAYGLFNRMDAGTLDRMNPGFRGFYKLRESEARYAVMRRIMDETGLTVTQVVLGYLRGQPFTTVPIVGCRTTEQVADSLSAGDVALTPEQIAAVDGAEAPE